MDKNCKFGRKRKGFHIAHVCVFLETRPFTWYHNFLARLQSNSGLWIDDVRLSVRLLSTFWLTFAFQFWNLHCNPAIPSSVVSCNLVTLTLKCGLLFKNFVLGYNFWIRKFFIGAFTYGCNWQSMLSFWHSGYELCCCWELSLFHKHSLFHTV